MKFMSENKVNILNIKKRNGINTKYNYIEIINRKYINYQLINRSKIKSIFINLIFSL